MDIEQYKQQLNEVERAILVSVDSSERESLLSLKSDLLELLELATNDLDEQLALFNSEIQSLDNPVTDEGEDQLSSESGKEDLESMIGEKCSAPHTHSWGAVAYHNAIICGLSSDQDNVECFKILFTNPTHQEMIPCSYFLEGECKFDENRCRFSHGELVPVKDVREYHKPDFTKLRKRCVVLAKLDDNIWHKGQVVNVNATENSCIIKIEAKRKDVLIKIENILPIYDDDSDSDESSDYSIIETDADVIPDASVLTLIPDRPLGDWEKHTKGIGSKLMAKMGYVYGTGLGSKGKGIIIPVSAQILPPGRSLDYCMNLREAANGDKDFFTKKLDNKSEAANIKAYNRECSKTDIFSFINNSIAVPTDKTTVRGPGSSSNSNSNFNNHTNKHLNVASVKIADDIRKKEKELTRIKDSLRRQTVGSDIHKKIQSQLSAKNEEIRQLKISESSLAREQTSRKTRDKLNVF